ncbi:MAG: zinc-dependent alcohol dehydrogenase family protein [Candidatus Scalindua sp.]|nr:zinc-dependent alcohol dehydrogenase family protein [Candidatus Scalindua sp.]
MKAMILKKTGSFSENKDPLELVILPEPVPLENEILIRVSACGVCHTELDEIEGRISPPGLPVILGHQVVGTIAQTGRKVSNFKNGERVGVGWFYSSCERCRFCLEGNENLCQKIQATGRDVNGGYAQYMTVPERSAFHIPDLFSDSEAAPLLCAGAIGYRSLRLTGLKDGQNLGLTGFGASAHLVLQMVRYRFPNSKVYVSARSERERAFAMELGAEWTGATEEDSPEKLDCIIDTTPVWRPIIQALKNLESGGRLVINAIRKEERDKESLLELDYPAHLWMEKEIKSVANVSRGDIRGFLELAAKISIKPEVQEFSLEEANVALSELKEKKIRGAKVLVIT